MKRSTRPSNSPRKAEAVAESVVTQVKAYMASSAPVGPHLADQLLLPIALAGKGAFRCSELTQHTLTNIEFIRRFLGVQIRHAQVGKSEWEVAL